MSKKASAEKVPLKQKATAFVSEFKDHWNTPAEGKYVPYKEYISISNEIRENLLPFMR